MSQEPIRNARRIDFFGGLLALITLLIIANYATLYLRLPDFGFRLDPSTWKVVQPDYRCTEDPRCLRLDDQVIRYGEVEFGAAQNDRGLPLVEPQWLEERGGSLRLVFRRGEQEFTLEVEPTQDNQSPIRLALTILFPLLFWLTGTIAVLFLRPRDERWVALILFQYNTALWISAGFLSSSQLAYSSLLFHVVIWFFLPLAVHLHWVLPDSLMPRAKMWLIVPLYLFAALLSVLDAMLLIPRSWFLVTTLIGMVASLLILLLRNLRRVDHDVRVANRVMLYGTTLGLGPVAFLILYFLISPVELLASSRVPTASGLFLLISPLWPMTYMYAVYRHDLATFEFRANRLLGIYGYLAFNLTAFLTLFHGLVGPWRDMGGDIVVFALAISSLFVVLGPALYGPFQRRVDRHVFGIKYRPNEVVSAFAQKIPTALDREILRDILLQEVLPTLMIRQSALLIFGQEEVETLYQQNVETALNDEAYLRDLLLSSGKYISFGSEPSEQLAWVRLILPLSVRDRTLGIWLLGRRDPDDYYPKSDITLLRNLANQVAPVIENFRLVEKARAEVQENRRLQQQLLQSQKMEAIGRLSAGVAHDFNNILSVIIGYSNLLLVQYPGDDRLQQSISSIRDAGNRAASLTKQLLAFSRQQALEPQVTNLNAVVTDVEKMLLRLTGEDIELRTDLLPGFATVRVDSGQMSQVLINLVVNARDAMPEGGKITIRTSSLEVEDPAASPFEGLPTGRFIVLSVIDDGEGIEESLLSRIFEPYFTTKDVGKGTGLGLSMVYGIVSQTEGQLFVDSTVGEGSVFTVCLPAVSETERRREDRKANESISRPGTGTILLVEDEASVREVTTRILESSGYRVVTAVDGQDALDQFESRSQDFDLLLTDVVMPGMKGTELAQRLLVLDPDLKIVFISGYNEELVLDQGQGQGRVTLIPKPFSPQTLTQRIGQVLDAKRDSED